MTRTMPDCGDSSCRYAKTKTGMRTNGGCRCDRCPACLADVRPGTPHKHYSSCHDKSWVPEHLKDTTVTSGRTE